MKKNVIGIDIGGTNTVFGVTDEAGGVLAQGRFATGRYADPDEYAAVLAGAVRRAVAEAGADGTVAGIGIGAPNASARGTIENAPNLPWKGSVPLVERLRRHFPELPIKMTNDARAAALGEWVYGAARGMRDFAAITLGTGLGSGLVVNGAPVAGLDGAAAELGHTIVRPDGRLCGCGRRGCLETYASATGIRRTVFELLAERTEGSLFRHTAFEEVTAEAIARAAGAGDALAIEAFEVTGLWLGRALAGMVQIVGPRAIFLLGGLAAAGELIFEPTRRAMEAHLHPAFRGRVALLPSGVTGGHAAILGAAALIRIGAEFEESV